MMMMMMMKTAIKTITYPRLKHSLQDFLVALKHMPRRTISSKNECGINVESVSRKT